jgi:flagellar hook assembly protein FlgD
MNAGENLVEWDGKSTSGNSLMAGTYLLVLEGKGFKESEVLIYR